MKLSSKKERRFSAIAFAVVLCMVFVRFCAYGLTYYWQLDDYIQYWDYAHRGSRLEVIRVVGLLGARPLAGLADVYFWSGFSGCMILAVLLVSAMFALSAVLFWRVFNRKFGTGPLFIVLYTLMPLNFEATYWLSASTRIVTGLFFASLALHFFCRYVDGADRKRLFAFMLCMVISCGFYEQILVLSLAAVLLFALLEIRKTRRALWGLFSFAAVGIYFLFTSAFSDSAVYGGRTELMLPFVNADYFTQFLPDTLSEMARLATDTMRSTVARGGRRGLECIVSDGLYLYLAAVAVFAAAFALVFRKKGGRIKLAPSAVIIAVILIIAPTAPFFVLKNGGYSVRCITASMPGAALLADTLIMLLLRGNNKWACVLAAVLAVGMSICTVSELRDWRDICRADNEIVSAVAQELTQDGVSGRKTEVCIFNMKSCYLTEQNYYTPRLHGVTEAGWSFSGALECYMGPDRPFVTPLGSNIYNCAQVLGQEYDFVYVFAENGLETAYLERSGGGWNIVSATGEELLGSVDEVSGDVTLSARFVD